ncbi:hypothetical protein H0H87_008321 [Tephrocybe sp. NHM501043]|nr:hypothetical protein H0H87_008321 [Tephrocybe sp. NHM501043]
MNLWSSHNQDPGHRTLTQWTQEVDMDLKPTGEKSAPSNPKSPARATFVDAQGLPVLADIASRSSSARRRRKRPAGSLRRLWTNFKRRVGSGTAPSSSSVIEDSAEEPHVVPIMSGPVPNDNEIVDEVVVDRVWSEDITTTDSEHDLSPEKSDGNHRVDGSTSDGNAEESHGLWGTLPIGVVLRWRIWPAVVRFFDSRFSDPKSEAHYAQESWFIKKSLALWASVWLILIWVLGCIFARPLNQNYDRIIYYGVRLLSYSEVTLEAHERPAVKVAPLLTLPVIFMVIYDWPRDRNNFYQVFLTFSVWLWAFYFVLFLYLCPFYPNTPHVHLDCQRRDFLGIHYYTTALQVIALFGLKLNRLPAAIGASTFFVIACIFMIPLKNTWVRSMINFFLFHSFLIYVHYITESSERRLYTLRDQLKVQYKVRVPLNTALLAVQNMAASGTVAKEQDIEFSALKGSLQMMSKVLNDVLDFNRMDSGQFESVYSPYGFHPVMRSLFKPLSLEADAQGLIFETELDPKIDQIARVASYKALGEDAATIRKHMSDHPDVDGIVIGDEARLRQIITNLARLYASESEVAGYSNACKFTSAGGKLTIKTKLVLPATFSIPGETICPVASFASDFPYGITQPDAHPPLSASHLSQHNSENGCQGRDYIVVRIEVTDTGYGIKPRDIIRNKLFTAWNQTEKGRLQGGKGTGLGLALVRQIVKLSGGRLGVRSKLDVGSTFWVELPLGIGSKTIINPNRPNSTSLSATRGSGSDDQINISGEAKDQTLLALDNGFTLMDPMSLEVSQASSETRYLLSAKQDPAQQGNREELDLQRHASLSPVNGRSDTSSPPHKPVDKTEQTDGVEQSSPLEEQTNRPIRSRPTFVPMPSRRSFRADAPPTNASNISRTSDPLAQFDAVYTRNSPSGGPPPITVSIEPALSVLVVDDDAVTRTLMKRLLERLGCHVSTAENGEVALEMILGPLAVNTPSSVSSGYGPILEPDIEFTPEGKFGVVFLDNQMPVLSGIKTVQKLRALGRTDLVVGVTGNALPTDQDEYLQAGVDRILTKPVKEQGLIDMLILADEHRKSMSHDLPPQDRG